MKKTIPTITVGMPVYNGEAFLEQAIESILSQTFGDFEFLISDNASTDRTEEICQDYVASDSRIHYLRNHENLGAAANYNVLFKSSRAPYFRWMNADDLAGKDLHQSCLQTLLENPDAALAYGRTQLIDQNGVVLKCYDDNLNLQQDQPSERFIKFFQNVGLTNVIYGLMRRDKLAKTSLMGNGSMPAVDIRMMAELSLVGKFIEIPEPLFYRRIHPRSYSWDSDKTEKQKAFWSANKQNFWMPTWRLYLSYVCYVCRLSIPTSEKWKILCEIGRWMRWQRTELMKELPQIVRFHA